MKTPMRRELSISMSQLFPLELYALLFKSGGAVERVYKNNKQKKIFTFIHAGKHCCTKNIRNVCL